MNKEQVMSLLRHIFSAVGGILIAYGVAGESAILDASGALLTAVSVYYSIKNKESFDVTMIEGAIRQLLTAGGAFLSFLTPSLINEVVGAIVAVLPIVLGQTDKYKKIVAPVVETATEPAAE